MSASGQATGHALRLDAITHRFGTVRVIDAVGLDIRPGELVALLGPSGCGKTTLLRIVAGFLAPTAGRVLVDGEPIGHLPPHRRGVGIVFQNYALFPHMTVAENIAYGLQARGEARAVVRERVAAMLTLVRMDDFADRMPRQLSGGQQQRVALARALAVGPRILLLDEPFGALDKNLRLDMQIEIKQLQRRAGITSILVTHDQEEAMSVADRIAVLDRGRVEQFAPPAELYDRPATLFVNTFVGTTNRLPGKVDHLDAGGVVVALDCGVLLPCAPARARAGDRVVVSVRPERLRVVRDAAAAAGAAIPGTLRAVLPLGPVVVYEVETGDGTSVKISQPREGTLLKADERVAVDVGSRGACLVFAAPAPGDALTLERSLTSGGSA